MSVRTDILFSFLEQKEVSSSKLSANTGISTGNISDWKSGKSAPKAEALLKIADYLDCSVDYLLGRTNNSQSHKTVSSLSDEETKLLSYFNGFNSEGKEEAMKRLDEMSALNRYKKPSEVSEKFY